MKKVIVVGCYVGGYAVIRALGQHNLHIIAMIYDDLDTLKEMADFAQVSRYVAEVVSVPHPREDEHGFVKFFLDNLPRWEGALILETGDIQAVTIAKHKEQLSKHYRIVTADWGTLRKFIDKHETYRLAEACGVPCPKSFTMRTMADLDVIQGKITYPCLIKPVSSHEFVNRFRAKNFQVENEEQLDDKLQLCLDADLVVMVQELIAGPDTDLYSLHIYINSKQEIGAAFFNNKVRQRPPRLGVGRVVMSAAPNPEVAELSRRLLMQVNYRGYADIEFRKDARDGQLKLIEVNARMPRNGWLAVACGVNFPWIIYQDLVNNRQVYVKDYPVGLYWIELYPDLYSTVFSRHIEKLGVHDFLSPYMAKQKSFAVLNARDPMPFLKHSATIVRRLSQGRTG